MLYYTWCDLTRMQERESIPGDFWEPLGGAGPIAPASSVPEDREAEVTMRSVGILYLVGAFSFFTKCVQCSY